LEYHAAPKYKSFRLFGPGASCGPEIQLQAHFFGVALGNGELEADFTAGLRDYLARS